MDLFVRAETANNCGDSRSFANRLRIGVSHVSAPERHAFASGTM
ncbi:hypothetical protein BJ969_003488 [Saccharopolyspora gloriosae]|uniref:Uncharacterized protein n=1 Tax=Saccharopolyspora gloriosae TaxID=455344 RepID=A0A840NEQ0_9PSEU|nr:hypothetical protein [Saccharopolyspora gloriosae]MBB5070400.1 hypothetical protein [Saccharopolyspora gloriosae]